MYKLLVQTECPNAVSLIGNSSLYRIFLAQRDEILRHKWIESEKVGHDIGFEAALVDWMLRYRSGWHRAYLEKWRTQPAD